MSIARLTDAALVQKTLGLVREERELLTTILHHLREIERRRLFSELGFKSLFEFATRKLGYSEDQAYRRIQAMRILKELPELEEKIASGDLSLTHLGLAQSLFRQEKNLAQEFSKKEKLAVFDEIANKSIREAEKVILSLQSIPFPPRTDSITAVTGNQIEIRFTADERLREKIEKLKGLLAHQEPDLSLGVLFDKLCDLGFETWSQSAPPRKRRVKLVASKAETRRQVFLRAKNQCEQCGSGFALEVDHIYPRAKGGSSGLKNLRVLCRSCNQRAAIREFGVTKMTTHLEKHPPNSS